MISMNSQCDMAYAPLCVAVCLQVSALPVVDEQGALLDIYARADITKLCKGNAYSRLQWEDVTVGTGWDVVASGEGTGVGKGVWGSIHLVN
jgi:hypothetical protein